MQPLEEARRDGWQALCGPHGAEFYARLMLDEGLMVFPGMRLTKAEALEAMRQATPWSSFELSDLRVVIVGADAGLVVYTASAVRDGRGYRAWMSSVYVQREGAWRLLLHQQSP